MEVQNNQKSDLEVTGVSRSGRVRKKSSKLMDFQSPDEIETRVKKVTPVKQTNIGKQFQNYSATSMASPTFGQSPPPTSNNNMPFSPGAKSDDELLSGDDFPGGEPDDSLESDGDSEEIIDETHIENEEDDENYIDPTVRQSIYMSEKANKKKVIKDGKIVFSKAQRKDKGKTRFTAYMLWARDVRKQMLHQQPDLDFATISRRLGEMWANVPTSEKYNWKRRAKRLASRSKTADRKETTKLPSKFLNRGQSNRTKKPSVSETAQHSDSVDLNANAHSSSNKSSPTASVGIYKVTGIDPLDVAAHLKLLGDSLTIIGERLKEHEGQITVSGSLSVLLDSLLCSLGPLMCLTTQIPGLGNDNNQHLKESLQSTLDNIAYVMPGL